MTANDYCLRFSTTRAEEHRWQKRLVRKMGEVTETLRLSECDITVMYLLSDREANDLLEKAWRFLPTRFVAVPGGDCFQLGRQLWSGWLSVGDWDGGGETAGG